MGQATTVGDDDVLYEAVMDLVRTARNDHLYETAVSERQRKDRLDVIVHEVSSYYGVVAQTLIDTTARMMAPRGYQAR
jgi:hypothetical protein